MVDNIELTTRLPQGKAHTRDYALRPRVPRDQEISNSVLDTIWNKLLYRRRTVELDSFETFLRDLKEVTLADIYHTLNEKPAASFEGLVWFAVSRQGSSGLTFTSLFPNENVGSLSVFEAFHQFRTDYEQASPGTLRLCCLTKTAPIIKRLFSYFRLFTLSAYAEPQFWARTLLAYLLCWSGYASQEFVEILLQSSDGNSNADEDRVFCLPSRAVSASPGWDFQYVWPFNVPEFSVFDIHTRRPYKAKPSMEKIQLYNGLSDDGSYKTTLLFDSTRALARFKSLITQPTSRNSEGIVLEASMEGDPLKLLYGVILTIHEQMDEESYGFAIKVMRRAKEIVVHSRDHPGRAEYLYLLMLQDYVTLTLYHLQAAKVQLYRQLPDTAGQALTARKDVILKDTDYLIESLNAALRHLGECQQQAKSLEELKQNQIAGIIGFLVAVYVPVAFVSSYFGMNTVEILTGNLHNSLFWQIAIPLMVLTIMLPLSLSIIARVARALSLSASAFSLRQWPMIVDLCLTCFCLSLATAHVVHWRRSGHHQFKELFRRISPDETVIVDGIFACFGLLKAVENSVLRNRRGRKWCFLWLVMTSLCAGLSVLDDSIATLLTPFGFVFFTLAVRPLLF